MNYDEAIKATERLYDETIYLKSESPFPNRSDRDFLIKFIETAKKEHEELSAIKQRAEEKRNDGNTLLREIELIDYILEGETK